MSYSFLYCTLALEWDQPILEALAAYWNYVTAEVLRLAAADTLLQYQVSRSHMDEGVRMVLVSNNGELLKHVPPHLLTLEMCIAAVKNCPRSLRWIPEKLRLFPLCVAAINMDPTTLQYIAAPNLDMIEVAVRSDYTAFQHITEPTLVQCLRAVDTDGRALRYVPLGMQSLHPALMTSAIVQHPGAILYAQMLTPETIRLAFNHFEGEFLRKHVLGVARALYEVEPLHPKIVGVADNIMSVLEAQDGLVEALPWITTYLVKVVNQYTDGTGRVVMKQ